MVIPNITSNKNDQEVSADTEPGELVSKTFPVEPSETAAKAFPAKLPCSRRTIIKLASVLLEDLVRYSEDYVPKDNYLWYRRAGIHKSTFLDTVNTYSNFILFSHDFLCQDLADCFSKFATIDIDTAIDIFLNLFVEKPEASTTGKNHNNRRRLLFIATYKYSPLLWQDLFFFLLPVLKRNHPFVDEAVLKGTLKLYAGAIRNPLVTWLKTGALLDELPYYKRLLIKLKLQLDNKVIYDLIEESKRKESAIFDPSSQNQ